MYVLDESHDPQVVQTGGCESVNNKSLTILVSSTGWRSLLRKLAHLTESYARQIRLLLPDVIPLGLG